MKKKEAAPNVFFCLVFVGANIFYLLMSMEMDWRLASAWAISIPFNICLVTILVVSIHSLMGGKDDTNS